jgi:outer membrane protein assembly factor BamB
MSAFLRILLALACLAALAARAQDDDWPTWQHDAARTGRTTEFARVKQFPEMPKAAWKFSFPERVHFRMQPIVVKGVVYVGCMDGKLYAFSARDGAQAWTFQADGEITNAPTVDDGVAVFGTCAGCVYGVSTADGRKAWVKATGGPVMSSAAVADGVAFIASFDGNLYALDVKTGAEKWKLATGNKVVQSPAARGGRVFVGSEDLCAYCADAKTGQLLWKSPVGGLTLKWGYPVIAGETVAFTTVQPGRGFAGGYKGGRYSPEEKEVSVKDETILFDVKTGERKFPELRVACWYYNMIPPVVKDDDTFWLLDAELHVLNLKTGKLETCGRHSTRGDERPCPSIGGDGLLYGVIDQNVFTYDVAGRKVERNLWGTAYLHRKPPDCMIGDNLMRFSTGTGGGGAGCGSTLVMSGGMGYVIVYSWLYAFKLSP